MVSILNLRHVSAGMASLIVFGAVTSPPAFSRTETNNDPSVTVWTLHDRAQIAIIGTTDRGSATFAGIQCDPFQPRSYRMIFGTKPAAGNDAVVGLLQNQSEKLMVSTRNLSLSAAFAIYPEDRGTSDFGGGATYAAAYLTAQQLETLSSAQSFAVRIGKSSFTFSGVGARAAINGLRCIVAPRRLAERLIPNRREDESSQKLESWKLLFHSGAAARLIGRADAYASTTNHPANTAANFRIGVACTDKGLYARIGAGISPGASDAKQLAGVNGFIRDFENKDKMIEVYRAGRRISTLLIDREEMRGPGHLLSTRDFASLIEADSLTVVGTGQAIDFSTANAKAVLTNLERICSRAP